MNHWVIHVLSLSTFLLRGSVSPENWQINYWWLGIIHWHTAWVHESWHWRHVLTQEHGLSLSFWRAAQWLSTDHNKQIHCNSCFAQYVQHRSWANMVLTSIAGAKYNTDQRIQHSGNINFWWVKPTIRREGRECASKMNKGIKAEEKSVDEHHQDVTTFM